MSTWKELKDNGQARANYETRLRILGLIRDWFSNQEFLEADTPCALRYPGQEPYLNPVAVDFKDPLGRQERFYLQTSPEFSLKKLLAANFGKIFQLAKCFRNEESFGGTHNIEFTLLEWYRAPGSLKDMMDDIENLFKFVGKKLVAKELKLSTADQPLKTAQIDCEWERKSMRELWREYVGVELNDYLDIESIKNLCVKLGYDLEGGEYEDYFYKIFLNKIERNLGVGKPVFAYDYPVSMCSLSRPAADPRYGERFELYVNGLELANCFGELIAADAQAVNLENDRKLREKLGRPTWKVDLDFIAALRSGVPGGCAGGGSLGVDRMVMLFTGARDINEVIFESVFDQLSF